MVLTEDEYREEKSKAKSNSRQSRLFKLRNVTKSYIIQCLADREIQRYSINDDLGQQSKAYGYNCKVVHSPEKYAHVSFSISILIYFFKNSLLTTLRPRHVTQTLYNYNLL
jgi:hypothetical protein